MEKPMNKRARMKQKASQMEQNAVRHMPFELQLQYWVNKLLEVSQENTSQES